MTNTLIAAAQAVVDRWDTPAWKDVEHTAVFINRLRAALTTAAAVPPEGWVMVPVEATVSMRSDDAGAPQPAVQQGADFWPVDGKASRKQLIEQIGQMNYRLTALRQENAGLITRVQGQAEALRNYQSAAAPVAQGDAEDAARYRWLRDETLVDGEINDEIYVHVDSPDFPNVWALTGSDLDAAIDAARSQAKEGA